jgi:hypothetical protein
MNSKKIFNPLIYARQNLLVITNAMIYELWKSGKGALTRV